jgi:hypothetical protein
MCHTRWHGQRAVSPWVQGLGQKGVWSHDSHRSARRVVSRSRKAAARQASTEATPRQLLTMFIEAADALAATPVLRHADTFSGLTLSWKQGEPLRWTVTEPTPDQLDLLRYRLRPFLLGDDWTHLKRMYTLLTQQVRSPRLRRLRAHPAEVPRVSAHDRGACHLHCPCGTRGLAPRTRR